MLHTESSRMLDAFKSRKITFAFKECKNANPRATPIAMLTRVAHAIGWTLSAQIENKILGTIINKLQSISLVQNNML